MKKNSFDNNVTVAGLLDFKDSQETVYASHYGSGISKRLVITHAGGYKVYEQNVVVLETMSPKVAVDKYNSI